MPGANATPVGRSGARSHRRPRRKKRAAGDPKRGDRPAIGGDGVSRRDADIFREIDDDQAARRRPRHPPQVATAATPRPISTRPDGSGTATAVNVGVFGKPGEFAAGPNVVTTTLD